MDQVVAIRPPQRGIPRAGAQNLRDLDPGDLADWLTQHSPEPPPRHRADQLFRWLHQRRAADFSVMSDLPAGERTRLAGEASLARLHVDAVLRSHDGTRKLRLRTAEGAALESVLIPNDERGAVHYEAEIAVLIGKPLSRKPNAEEVLDAISGFAPALDLTLRAERITVVLPAARGPALREGGARGLLELLGVP